LFLKNKYGEQERILKASWEKHQLIHKGKSIRITDFSIETLKSRRAWNDVFINEDDS
jgi:hypothetical protein